MKAVPYVIGGVVLLLVGLGIGRWVSSLHFEQTQIDAKSGNLNMLAERRTVDLTATSKEGVLSVVGLVLVADPNHDPATPRTFDSTKALIQFRPKRELLALDPLNVVLYQGKVSRQFSLGGSYTAFTAQLGEDQLAEVTVKDDLFVGYKEPTTIPFADLKLLKRDTTKTYFFVESATLTSVASKKFRKSNSKTQLSGTAFSADGSVFVSTEEFTYETKLSVTVWDIALLTPGADVPQSADRERLLQLQAKNQLGADDGKRLATILHEESKPKARMMLSAAVIKPPEDPPKN